MSLLFVYCNLLAISLYDCWKMAKSEFLYWGYGVQTGAFNPVASNQASLSQFALFYFYVAFTAFAIFDFWTALLHIACIGILHWFGTEDFFYFCWSKWVRFPEKYISTHQTFKFLLFDIPLDLKWLYDARKVGAFSIPSIIGLICGMGVDGKKFLRLVICVNLLFIITVYIVNV